MSKTPKLRFKEFSGDWETGIISDYGYFYYGKSAPKWSITTDAKIPCIRYGELYTTHNEIVKEIKTYTNMSKENLKFSKGGEVLVPRVGEKPLEFSKCTYLPFKDIAIGEMISVYNTNQNPLFIVYYFRSKMKYKFARMVEGGNVSNLYYSYLEKIHISIPSKEEQEKIASFFSLIDDKISLQSEKVEALKDYKKGMMQKIFSRELRFKDNDGRDYPEWEEKKLGDVLKSRIEKQVPSQEAPLMSFTATGGIEPKGERYDRSFLVKSNKKLGDVLKSRIEKQVPSQEAPLMSFTATGGIEPKGERYDRSFLVKSNSKLYKRTELNDFIYSSNNLDVGSIGLNKYGTAVISDVYEIFNVSKEASCDFISELIQTPRVLNKVIRYRQGVMYGQYRIHADEFLKIREFMPCLEEQNKISTFISNIEVKIEKEQEKLKYLNGYKKGLLQQMFV